MKSFCDIKSRNELANFLGIPIRKLTHILYVEKTENRYSTFEIPKKSGGTRKINAPANDLKSVQSKLAKALYQYQQELWENKGISPNISHAFLCKKGILTNAKVHRNKRFVLKLDLKDFFDSFHFGRVRGFFAKSPDFQLPIDVATVIAQLTCYNGCLPQGAPSSPIITNLICKTFDIHISKIAKKYLLDYTRYADDLIFSTNNKHFIENYNAFLIEISMQIKNEGFRINEKKTQLQFKDSRQKVTGIIVNKKLNIDRRYYRDTKAMANRLYTTGAFSINGVEGTINQLEGRFSFINQIDKYNNKLDKKIKHDFRKLNGREKEFRKFLFFKYFYNNDKPLIVTEGITDVVYIKSALKCLYRDYPNLIEKRADGSFDFKISFLKRSDKLNYFFGVGQDGANAMKNIYNYFTEIKDSGFYNYYNFFMTKCKCAPQNPVILIFDNEINNKKKPLKDFTNHANLSEEQIKELQDSLKIKLIKDGNLFLATNQLIDGKEECEIEDLFPLDTLNISLNGKKFCKNDDHDTEKYFGKRMFSDYVSHNYNNIDFVNFKRMLDNINEIVQSYKTIMN